MAIGGGKYDREITDLMHRLKADGIILIVTGGTKGHGFSIAGTPQFIHMMPDLLRATVNKVCAEYEQDMKDLAKSVTQEEPWNPDAMTGSEAT
jgi:tRNA A37 N6-isopentenylltransferase MiaA